VGVAALFALTARHGGGSWDYWTANYASWHLVHTGSPWIDGVHIDGLSGTSESGTWIKEAANGHTVISRFPGVVAIGLPAYALAGADHMTVVPGAMTAAAASAASIVLVYLALRRYIPTSRAVGAALALAFATPVWSISADAVWPHTVTVLGISAMAYGAASGRWWLVGLGGGVALWGRLHAALLVALVGVLLAWHRRQPRIVVVVGAISALFLVLLCTWTRWMYGSWDPTASYGQGVFDVGPRGWDQLTNQLGMWVAPDRGILVWTPILVLLAPAVRRSWRDLPDWARYLLVGGFLYTLLQSWLIVFTGGDNFYGYRLGLEFLVCAAPAYAIAATRAGAVARALMPAVLALQTCAFMIGAVFNAAFLPEEDVWHDNGFLFAMRELWPVGPVVVVVVLGAVVTVQMERRRKVVRGGSARTRHSLTPDRRPGV
jgi:alpha-1,2-mannosyltransferase